MEGRSFLVYPKRHESCCSSMAAMCAVTYDIKKGEPVIQARPPEIA